MGRMDGRRLKEYIEWKWNGLEGKKDLIGYVSSKLKSLSSKKIGVLRGWQESQGLCWTSEGVDEWEEEEGAKT